MTYDLSVLIPARNEEFLGETIADVMANKQGKTEVIAVLDGALPLSSIPDYEDLQMILLPSSIGQRAATNLAARVSRAKFVMKLDAHCRVDEGFDVALMADCSYRQTIIPRQYNLHAFNWKCLKCGIETYQGPKPDRCIVIVGTKEKREPNPLCNGTRFERVMVWAPNKKPPLDGWRFDSDLHYQQWGLLNADEKTCARHNVPFRPEEQGEITPTMSCLGACWFLHRARYFELGGLDEQHGSWGQMGSELACKSWLSGGEMLTNKKAWFAHLFRTQPGFNFPYAQNASQVDHAKAYSQDLWRKGKWPKAIHPLSWLVEKFWPVPGWTQVDLDALKAMEPGRPVTVSVPTNIPPAIPERHVASARRNGETIGIAYYTENRCPEPIFSTVQTQLLRAAAGADIVSVSLAPISFGENYVLNQERGWLTMFQQILLAVSHLDTDFVALCEHDCLYAPEHFQFVPPRRDAYYYNENIYDLSAKTGHALFRYRRSLSQLIADRRLLISHFQARIAAVEKEGFHFRNGFEPGTRSTRRNGYDDYRAFSFWSPRPNIDIRDHGTNNTRTLWKQEDFRNKKYTEGWKEVSAIPGWGLTEGRFAQFLEDVRLGRLK